MVIDRHLEAKKEPRALFGLLDTSRKRHRLRNRIVRFLERHGNFASFSIKDVRDEIGKKFPNKEILISDIKDRIGQIISTIDNPRFIIEGLTHFEEAEYFRQELGMEIVNTSEFVDPEGHTSLRSRLEKRFQRFIDERKHPLWEKHMRGAERA